MESIDDQLKKLDAELEHLQKDITYKVDEHKELKNFILEVRAHQFAITNLVCSILAKMNESSLSLEKQRYEVFRKGRLIELFKNWIAKYAHTSGSKSPPSSLN